MTYICPNCKQEALPTMKNEAESIFFCTKCNNPFKFSESYKEKEIKIDALANPPEGAWFRNEPDRIVFGATTKHSFAFFLVPFTLIMSFGIIGGIYGTQIYEEKFNPVSTIFGIPALFFIAWLWCLAFLTLCGKVEISIGEKCYLFTGVGFIGRKKYFDLSTVTEVVEDKSKLSDHPTYGVVIVGTPNKVIKFGMGVTKERTDFMFHALKYLHQNYLKKDN